jgi:hypothetical protein
MAHWSFIQKRRKGPGDEGRDWSLGFAICGYLIAERREGATLDELDALQLAGRSAGTELPHVRAAVAALVADGNLELRADRVMPGEVLL